MREKFHSSHIVEHLTLIDPLVQARLQSYSASYSSVIADPSLRNTQGMRAMATAATREANVLAYNDVFMLISLIAVLTMIWISARVLWLKMTTQPLALAPVAPAASPSVSNSGVKSS